MTSAAATLAETVPDDHMATCDTGRGTVNPDINRSSRGSIVPPPPPATSRPPVFSAAASDRISELSSIHPDISCDSSLESSETLGDTQRVQDLIHRGEEDDRVANLPAFEQAEATARELERREKWDMATCDTGRDIIDVDISQSSRRSIVITPPPVASAKLRISALHSSEPDPRRQRAKARMQISRSFNSSTESLGNPQRLQELIHRGEEDDRIAGLAASEQAEATARERDRRAQWDLDLNNSTLANGALANSISKPHRTSRWWSKLKCWRH
jgi:hypothetical protein